MSYSASFRPRTPHCSSTRVNKYHFSLYPMPPHTASPCCVFAGKDFCSAGRHCLGYSVVNVIDKSVLQCAGIISYFDGRILYAL